MDVFTNKRQKWLDNALLSVDWRRTENQEGEANSVIVGSPW